MFFGVCVPGRSFLVALRPCLVLAWSAYARACQVPGACVVLGSFGCFLFLVFHPPASAPETAPFQVSFRRLNYNIFLVVDGLLDSVVDSL